MLFKNKKHNIYSQARFSEIWPKSSLNKKFINNILALVKNLKLNVDYYIPSPLSSSLSTLSEDEKNLGTICIDLGHTTTSVCIFENKKFIFGDAFSVGSNNITNDIARGVSTTLASAERLKTLYGSVISSPSDENEIIEIPIISGENNQFNQINRSTVNAIIKPTGNPMINPIVNATGHGMLYATESAQTVIDEAVQIFGGQGVVSGAAVENLYREIRALRIYEGASEVQKVVIAKAALAAREF